MKKLKQYGYILMVLSIGLAFFDYINMTDIYTPWLMLGASISTVAIVYEKNY